MIFNLAFLLFVVFFSSHLQLIFTSRDYYPDDFQGLGDLPTWHDESWNMIHKDSSDSSSGSKRKRSENSKCKNDKRQAEKYYVDSEPINPKIDDKMVYTLRDWETKLHAKGKECFWDKFTELTKNDTTHLCMEIWKVLAPRIPEIKRKKDMLPDCVPSAHGNATIAKYNRYYKGFFQYLDSLEDKVFWPEVVRCNCAYVTEILSRRIRKTVYKSKKFFFIHRYQDTMYCVLTLFGEAGDKHIKLVDIHDIKGS